MRDRGQDMARYEIVHRVMRRWQRSNLSHDEALRSAASPLRPALQHDDPRRGVAFNTYAVPAIGRAIWRAEALAVPVPHPVPMPQPPQESPDPSEMMEKSIVHRAAGLFPEDFVVE